MTLLEIIHQTLDSGWTIGWEVVPDHIRDGYIEATVYDVAKSDEGTPVRIHVEVVEP